MTIPDNALTHAGKFHADDVFSTAFLKQLNPSVKVLRTFEVPEDFDGIVYDIGFGEFDHHQENAEIRENGIPYAAFGLLWRAYGVNFISGFCPREQAEKEAARFDETFIQPLDADDNTGCGNQLASAIGSFNPSWDSDESSDQCFNNAVSFASVLLQKKFESIKSIQRAKTLVESALADAKDKIVVLPKFAPWKMVLAPTDTEFVVYPSQRGGYSAQVVPIDLETKEAKCYFPAEWAGKPAETLKEISGVETLTFCHKGRFLISAQRMEDILKACRVAQNLSKK